MGYSTDFTGELKLRPATTVQELRKLRELFDLDRDAMRALGYGDGHVDLELTDDLNAIRWNGAEKTRGMDMAVTMLVKETRKQFPEFTLNGTLQAQGEDADDRWDLVVEDGAVRIVKYRMVGEKVTCPSCEYEFVPGGKFEPT